MFGENMSGNMLTMNKKGPEGRALGNHSFLFDLEQSKAVTMMPIHFPKRSMKMMNDQMKS